MVKLNEILEMWSKDKIVDSTNIQEELLKIPNLHGTYLEILSSHRIAEKKAHFDYAKMKKLRRQYYSGTLSEEEYQAYNWIPVGEAAKTKEKLDVYLEADEILIKLLEKKTYYEECIFLCESILKELNNRHWNLRTWVDYEKFKCGIN